MDVVSKSTGDSYTAAEFNQGNNELENTITSTGQTPAAGNLFQVSKAIADYAGGGDFYTDSGAADVYVLSVIGSKQAPTTYADGLRVRFVVGNTNTGASTVNVATLGVKNIVLNGIALAPGLLISGKEVDLSYDNANSRFELLLRQTGIIQTINEKDGAVATGTTIIPFDATIPQDTEGDQYLTASITPKFASSKLVIEVQMMLSISPSLKIVTMALFDSSDADALTASSLYIADAGEPYFLTIKHEVAAGSVSPKTFNVRMGPGTATTATFNGVSGASRLGGVLNSYIRITEQAV